MRCGWVVLALGTWACSETKPSPRGLRVPLPFGWVGTEGGSGILRVGPVGRAVLTLERRSAKLPSADALKAAVEAEGGSVVYAGGELDSITVRYTKAPARGLLRARTLEDGALLLCASTPEAAPEELEAVDTLCTQIRLEPGDRQP